VLLLFIIGLFEPPVVYAPGLNPIVIENQKASNADWELTNPAPEREIEGYASATSVNRGDAIEVFVSTRDPRYTIEIFRMGWYNGRGARPVTEPLEQRGIVQEMPVHDPATGLIECRWKDPVRILTKDEDGAWTSGVYLARLTARPSGKQSFVVFVVRDDERKSAILFQSSVTTFAAYNNWGGKSLYGFNSQNAPARKVSFDRPYATNPYGVRLDGAGDFLRRWEYNAVRFLERAGYDVTYITDVDTHQRADLLQQHLAFLSVGHDEYWSPAMRTHVEAGRDRGVHLAFLGAGACFWRIRFEPDSRGVANRTIVGYKEKAGDEDPLALDGNPANDRSITGRWRDRPGSRPEERLIGVMYAADPVEGDVIVEAPAHWAFAGTGLKRGDALNGLLGYEVDAIYGDSPAGLVRLAHSPFVDHGRTRYADMTLYTAESGAIVFASGSMQWNWGLDGYNAPAWHSSRTNESAQQLMRNVLNRMMQGRGEHGLAPMRRSNTVVLIATAIAALVVLRAWISSRMGRRDFQR
jgi:hypothetical protein